MMTSSPRPTAIHHHSEPFSAPYSFVAIRERSSFIIHPLVALVRSDGLWLYADASAAPHRTAPHAATATLTMLMSFGSPSNLQTFHLNPTEQISVHLFVATTYVEQAM